MPRPRSGSEQAVRDRHQGHAPGAGEARGSDAVPTSYGQNFSALEGGHLLAVFIAAELKLDVQLREARRFAARHREGAQRTSTTARTSSWVWKSPPKHGEHPTVINCIAAHHDDVAHESPISVDRAGGRRRVRLAAGGAPRGVRDVRQAAHPAGAESERVRRAWNKVCRDPGGPGVGCGRRDPERDR